MRKTLYRMRLKQDGIKMYIYSGECRMGNCGEKTGLEDFTCKELFVGDIVMASTIDKMGICNNYGLSAVVSDRWTSYSDGSHKEKESNIEYFVMGIKSVNFMEKDSKKWIVKKLKDWSECINGEHWKENGFSYRKD